MARGKKSGPSRLDLRRQNEAAEAQEVEEEDEAEDEEADDEEEAAEESDEAEAGDDEGDDDEAPKPKKKAAPKKKAVAKKPAAKRSRVKEPPRMRAIWVIFDNGSKRVKEFPYAQKADAERVLAEKQEEKKGTFYLQLVKEPMES
jgi:hypothetical protein